MASAAYKLGIKAFLDGDIDILNDTIKARLMRASAYTFSQAHDFVNDLPAAIVSDVTLGTKLTDAGSNPGSFDAADGVFASVPAGAAVDCVALYKDTGNVATSPLFLYLDGFSVVPNGGNITLVWAATSPFIWTINP